METGALLSGLACAVAVLVPMIGFFRSMDQRLTRLETLVEVALEVHAPTRKAHPAGLVQRAGQ